jgi:hypothetical protein
MSSRDDEIKRLEAELRWLREVKRIQELRDETWGEDEINRQLRSQIPPQFQRYLDRNVDDLEQLIERRERDLKDIKTFY